MRLRSEFSVLNLSMLQCRVCKKIEQLALYPHSFLSDPPETTDDAVRSIFASRPFNRAADYTYSHNYNWCAIRPWNCSVCVIIQVIRATPSKLHLWRGWSLAVWSQLSQFQLFIEAGQGWKIPFDSDGIWTLDLPTLTLKCWPLHHGCCCKQTNKNKQTKSQKESHAGVLKKRSKTHKRLKERFLIRGNRTKCANFRCNHLFRGTYNTTENS